ncbi:hypothetical protein [Corallococcus terminator]|nr:hypothetical protein [Corallococcus terminator]
MVNTRLIGLEHLIPWADAWVLKLEAPPLWLLELCTTQDLHAARGLLLRAACHPTDPFGRDEQDAEHLACLFVRYRQGALSWAAFLEEGGRYLDGANGSRTCEELYSLLNALEQQGHAQNMERAQSTEIERSLRGALQQVESVYRLLAAMTRTGG